MLNKNQPTQLCSIAFGVQRAEALQGNSQFIKYLKR